MESGLSRDDAYRIVQENAQRAWDKGMPFRELLAEAAPGLDLDAVFDPRRVRAPRARAGGRMDAGSGLDARLGQAAGCGTFPGRRPGRSVARSMAVLLGFLGVLGFSGSLPATRVAVEQLDPTFVGVGRAVVAGAARRRRCSASRASRGRTRAQLRPLALRRRSGWCSGSRCSRRWRCTRCPRRTARWSSGLLPAATAVAAVLFAGERPSGAFWAASAAGLVAVLVFAGRRRAPGLPSAADGLVLVAVALGALGYAEGGALSRELGGWQTICWALVLSLPLDDPASRWWPPRPATSPAAAAAWSGFAYVSLVSMFLGFFAWYAGLALGGIARIGQVQLAQPVLTLVWAALLLGEHVTAGMVAAALVVLACVVATQRTRVATAPPTSIGSLSAVSDSALLEGASSSTRARSATSTRRATTSS